MFAALPPPQSIITTEIEELWVENWQRRSLGDAAHAMTPNKGAGMAMEDAAVLAEELASGAFIERAWQTTSGGASRASKRWCASRATSDTTGSVPTP